MGRDLSDISYEKGPFRKGGGRGEVYGGQGEGNSRR